MDELATLIENILAADTDEARTAALAGVDLDQVETEMTTTAQEMLASGDDSDTTLETLEAIRDALTVVRAAKAFNAEVAEQKAVARAELAAEIGGELAAETDADAPAEGDEAVADGEVAPVEGETLAAEAAEEPAQAPVAKPKPSLSALRQFAPEDTKPESVPDPAPKLKVTAALDVPGRQIGQVYSDVREIAEAMIARRQALGNTRGDNVANERVAIAHVDYMDDLTQVTDDQMLNGLLLMKAGQPGALTASGGFGAPAQVIYDFVKVNQPSDLVQDFLPVVGAPRGSIQYPTSPDIRDAFTKNVANAYSNADDVAATHKSTAVIAAPAFNTCVVGAEYVILQFGNLGSRAYPEWVEHWVGLSMDAHAHKVSAKLITQMVAASEAAIAVGPNAGATGSVLHNLLLAAADLRHDLRMPKTAQLEVVLPSWFHAMVQSDLAMASKAGTVGQFAVTDSDIDGWLTSKNLTVRYVEDWQDITGNSAVGASVWPAAMEFLLYPPGTFVKLDMGTLDLGIVRDSTLNATNDYNIFVETFEQACKVGISSRHYVTYVCVNGQFSRDIVLGCNAVDASHS